MCTTSPTPPVTVPKDYVCGRCQATNCKLWRETGGTDLLCVRCAATDKRMSIESIDAEGMRDGRNGQRTDQIRSYLPAVPTPDGNYYSYGSVPQNSITWWRALPTHPA